MKKSTDLLYTFYECQISFFSLFISFFFGGMGWARIWGWTVINNFFHFLGGHLFKVGANSRLGTKSNKYSKCSGEFKSTYEWKPKTQSRVFTCLRILTNFAAWGFHPAMKAWRMCFVFFYKINISWLNKRKEDIQSVYMYTLL